MSSSDSQLDALGVIHYVLAGFVAFFGLMPLIHVAMGLGMVSGHAAGGCSASWWTRLPARCSPGTVLGVLTLVVLSEPEVKARFSSPVPT